jgi:hypothetical protein
MDAARRRWHVLEACLLSILLIVGLDLLTNSLDTHKFSWDFRYYVSMAATGFRAPMASPFAYRYVTPALVYAMMHGLGLELETAFRIVAYLGAFLQLVGVFVFTNWITRSPRGAFVAMAVTAFSLFNVKFLLFDVYRPDHLAYALIVLQSYFAFKRKFAALLILTVVASQVREFNLIPLLAYLFATWRGTHGPKSSSGPRHAFVLQAAISVVAMLVAVILPRMLIPVAEDFQFVSLSRDGILRALIAPLVLARDVNFLYALVAYFLPVLLLAGFQDFRWMWTSLEGWARSFLAAYVAIVLVFSFLGGTDFQRFTSYLFLPQAIMLGLFVGRRHPWQVGVTLLAVFVFNRIWLPFPMSDVGTYLDFYGGWAERFNSASVLRVAECLAFVAAGIMMRRLQSSSGLPASAPPA